MKFSAICTTYNEENNIRAFLESITKQTLLPDEFVIVDGGLDKTINIIRDFAKKHKWIKGFSKKGCNISEGRNIAIKKAKNEVIIAVDAGCKMDKNNFKHMVEPFKKGYDIVSGNWSATHHSDRQEAMARVLNLNLNTSFDEKRFIPSSRNIAFKKSCWKKIKGYRENLYTGEDTLFVLDLKEADCKFFIQKKAMVYWKMRENYKKFWKQFYLYGKGDKEAKKLINFRLNGLLNLGMVVGFWGILIGSGISLLYNPLQSLLIFSILPLYFTYGGLKVFSKTKRLKMFFHGAFALMIKRIGYIFGATFG